MSAVELVCRGCGSTWSRQRQAGQVPQWCPSCVADGTKDREQRAAREARPAPAPRPELDTVTWAKAVAAENARLSGIIREAVAALAVGRPREALSTLRAAS